MFLYERQLQSLPGSDVTTLQKQKVTEPVDAPQRDLVQRKKLGAFYTPLQVSTLLTAWGLRSHSDKVLEPCFGGCTFLEASVNRLKQLGNKHPEKNLFGCDIDPVAFTYLRSRVSGAAETGQFFEQDFLSLNSANVSDKGLDLVLGNPPYISYENIDLVTRELLEEWKKENSGISNRRSSLWAYFVLHGLNFLRNGGRVALVLPGSFLYASYAESVRETLRKSFARVLAIGLTERLFLSEGTEETTVILLGEGFNETPCSKNFPITCVDTVKDLEELISKPDMFSSVTSRPDAGNGIIPPAILDLYNDYTSLPAMQSLEDLGTVSIGLVTGDMDFFVKSASAWRAVGVDRRHLSYILPRSQFVSGIELTFERAREQINDDRKCLALKPPAAPRAEGLLNYLGTYPKAKKKTNATFAKRSVWYDFHDGRIPGAFLVFMTTRGPRLILNKIGANATNAVYRVFFKSNITPTIQKLAAISIHSTFSQVSAEIVGHPRGSGALKLEPSSALKIRMYMPERTKSEIENTFAIVDKHLTGGQHELARKAADDFLFGNSAVRKTIQDLENGLTIIRTRRSRTTLDIGD